MYEMGNFKCDSIKTLAPFVHYKQIQHIKISSRVPDYVRIFHNCKYR